MNLPADRRGDPGSHSELDLLAAQPLDGEDVAILLAMADFYNRHDPVPEGLADRLAFGVALAEMEAELAELQNVEHDLVGVRGDEPEEARTITFASGSLSAMVTISAENGQSVRIDGWVAPAESMDVDLRLPTTQASHLFRRRRPVRLHRRAPRDGDAGVPR